MVAAAAAAAAMTAMTRTTVNSRRADDTHQLWVLTKVHFQSGASDHLGTDCEVRVATSSFHVLLSYSYLYMRTRGHQESYSRARPNRFPPHRLAIRHPNSSKNCTVTSSEWKFWGNAFFSLSFPFFPSNNQFHSSRSRKSLAGFSGKHSNNIK